MWHPHPENNTGAPSDSDGGYLSSASDLMIGLLFVFIILVVVLSLEQQRQVQQQQQLAAEHHRLAQKNAERLRQAREAAKAAGDPRGKVTASIGEQLKAVLPNIRIDPGSGVISLPDDVLFDLGRSNLTGKGQVALAEAGQQLAKVLPCYVSNQMANRTCPDNPNGNEIETIFIEGHTDSIPLVRPNYDNMNLSLDRARSVYQALVQRSALEEYRNKAVQPLFSFSAYADTRPLKGIPPADARNRRVDLRIVMAYRPPELSIIESAMPREAVQ